MNSVRLGWGRHESASLDGGPRLEGGTWLCMWRQHTAWRRYVVCGPGWRGARCASSPSHTNAHTTHACVWARARHPFVA